MADGDWATAGSRASLVAATSDAATNSGVLGFGTLDASAASAALAVLKSAAFTDAGTTAGLTTQARQPARTRSYWDLGMNLDEAFMIWNVDR
jgi:hypothetical protein